MASGDHRWSSHSSLHFHRISINFPASPVWRNREVMKFIMATYPLVKHGENRRDSMLVSAWGFSIFGQIFGRFLGRDRPCLRDQRLMTLGIGGYWRRGKKTWSPKISLWPMVHGDMSIVLLMLRYLQFRCLTWPLDATLGQRLCWNIQAVHDVNQLLVGKHDRYLDPPNKP